MSREKILGSHVKRLLAGVAEHGQRHLAEVETDLAQTGLLLEEAIDNLSRNFLAIHAAVSAQQHTIELLLAGGAPAPEARAGLQAMQSEVGQHVNAAITSLQFQDMTGQLLERTLRRVTGLREFLGTLDAHGAVLLPDSDNQQIADLLKQVSLALAIQSVELRSLLRKAVNQQHLESGDIELF